MLLCLDEQHDHYIVFTVGTTLHFLHSDCLDALALRTGTVNVLFNLGYEMRYCSFMFDYLLSIS